MSAKEKARATPRGAWCCPHCKTRCQTLSGINRHLDRKHASSDSLGIYFTALELKAMKEKRLANV